MFASRRILAALTAIVVVSSACASAVTPAPPQPTTAPTVSPSGPSPSPTAVVSPSLKPSSTLVPAPAAARLWNDWVADAPPLGLRDQGPRIEMSIDWQDGRTVWVQTNYQTGTQVFKSDSVAAPDGQLRLVSEATSDGCTAGDVGTYGWNRSTDGLFLTLTVVADACSARATTLARTWVHSLNAVNDGGPGVLPVDNIQVTMPSRRFGLSGGDSASDLTTFKEAPFIELLLYPDPAAFRAPCSAQDGGTTATLPTSAAVVTYLRRLPGLAVTTTHTTIDGHPTVHVTGSPKPGATCPAGEIRVFPAPNGTGDAWSSALGTSLSVWVTDVDGHALVIWYRGDQVTAADEAKVITSIRFLTSLPTP